MSARVRAGEVDAVEAVAQPEELLAEGDGALVHHGHVEDHDGPPAEARQHRPPLDEAQDQRRDDGKEGVEQRVEGRDGRGAVAATVEDGRAHEGRPRGDGHQNVGRRLCGNQPVSWDVGAKLENSLARSNRSRFG